MKLNFNYILIIIVLILLVLIVTKKEGYQPSLKRMRTSRLIKPEVEMRSSIQDLTGLPMDVIDIVRSYNDFPEQVVDLLKSRAAYKTDLESQLSNFDVDTKNDLRALFKEQAKFVLSSDPEYYLFEFDIPAPVFFQYGDLTMPNRSDRDIKNRKARMVKYLNTEVGAWLDPAKDWTQDISFDDLIEDISGGFGMIDVFDPFYPEEEGNEATRTVKRILRNFIKQAAKENYNIRTAKVEASLKNAIKNMRARPDVYENILQTANEVLDIVQSGENDFVENKRIADLLKSL
jgi:hypothetical protein